MRVYELAKELNVSNETLLGLLKSGGFSFKSHMSALSDEALLYIRNSKKSSVEQKPDKDNNRKDIMQKEHVKKPAYKATPATKPVVAPKKSNPSFARKPEQFTPKPAPVVIPVVEAPQRLIIKSMTVLELATAIHKPVNELIVTLLRWGVVAAINQLLPEEVVERVARHYTIEPLKAKAKIHEVGDSVVAAGEGDLQPRLPVIVVLGHVDHGKTSLLDFIRKTRLVLKEKGGITQHLGAYEVNTSHGNLVFLDTPGHAAFPKMRQRGIKVADLAILVIAADDGIMPQTQEVIKNLKSMNIPMVVAINKVDKVEPTRIEVVKRQLAEHDLLPEDWGGQVVCVPISATSGKNVDQLLELVALQAEMLELRSTTKGPGRCYVLESKIEKGRGPVATLICQNGRVGVGDYFISGKTSGKVTSIKNSSGSSLDEAGPSTPIQIAGFNELPEVGDMFSVVSKEEYEKRPSQERELNSPAGFGAQKGSINLLIKTDAFSSKEALLDSIQKLSQSLGVAFNVVYAGVGAVNESDIELAFSTNSQVIGLHAKADTKTRELAQRRKISILYFDIIYKLLENLEEQVESGKEIEMERVKIGEATVRKVFDIKGTGVIAGSYVNDGRIAREGIIIGYRGRQKLGEGKITSLQRDRKSVKEVHTGFECGFVVEGITDWHEDDRAECYITVPKKSKK